MLASPHSSAQLMQLRESEAIRIFDHDDACVRNVDPDLNDGGRHEYVYLMLLETRHHGVFIRRLHLSMQKSDSVLRKDVRSDVFAELHGALRLQLFALFY